MHPTRPDGAASIDKALSLLSAILDFPDETLAMLVDRLGIPHSTAQRMAASLLRHGFVSRIGRGRYSAGLRIARHAGPGATASVLVRASRPLLRQLARQLGATVHLGVLEGDMVTYLVKEHGGGPVWRTREDNQLEAYCSAIGKVLLASLDETARERYLAAGPFVRMTSHTVTEVAALRAALHDVSVSGFATDRAEFENGLYCLAVPISGPAGTLAAAISASSPTDQSTNPIWRQHLQTCALKLTNRLS